ncbi:MAG TPA: hypothetical protein VHN37_14840 [Actinomycetota bacterium]|nr:hypothetical protein [Actinomycetota bacterium]
MTNRKKAALCASVTALVALAAPFGSSALAQETVRTHDRDVVFDVQHPCTLENVIGDTTVRTTVTETDNGNGTTTVEIHQKTHGQQLLGVVSGDWYTFNGAVDSHTTETILGSSGTVETKTIFIHTSEDVAFEEEPGMDDFHQRLDFIVNPLLPPTVIRDTGECK